MHCRHEQLSIRMAVGSALHHSFQPPHRSVIDVAVQTGTWIDISSDENDTRSSETNLSPTSTRPFAIFSTPEPVAPVPSTDDHACVLPTACSVPILHFCGDSVGIQGCVSLNNVLSSLVRNPVVPQIPEKIVETVNAIPQEWISERIVDIPVAQRNRPSSRALQQCRNRLSPKEENASRKLHRTSRCQCTIFHLSPCSSVLVKKIEDTEILGSLLTEGADTHSALRCRLQKATTAMRQDVAFYR